MRVETAPVVSRRERHVMEIGSGARAGGNGLNGLVVVNGSSGDVLFGRVHDSGYVGDDGVVDMECDSW